MTTTDEPLHLARRQLGDAVHALADPAPEWVDGVCRWSDSVYVRLRRELAGGKPIGRGAAQRSRAPCSIGVLALLVDIDTTVAAWESDATGTTERLHQLAERGWRPQDCDLLAGYCDRLQRWVVAAAELLGREPRVSLEVPCPPCEARFA